MLHFPFTLGAVEAKSSSSVSLSWSLTSMGSLYVIDGNLSFGACIKTVTNKCLWNIAKEYKED